MMSEIKLMLLSLLCVLPLSSSFEYASEQHSAEALVIPYCSGLDHNPNRVQVYFNDVYETTQVNFATSITSVVPFEPLSSPQLMKVYFQNDNVKNNWESFNFSTVEDLLSISWESTGGGGSISYCSVHYCLEEPFIVDPHSIQFNATAEFNSTELFVPTNVDLPLPGPTGFNGEIQDFTFSYEAGVEIELTLKTPGNTNLFYSQMDVFGALQRYSYTIDFDKVEDKSSTFTMRIGGYSIWMGEDNDHFFQGPAVLLYVRNVTSEGSIRFQEHFSFFLMYGTGPIILIYIGLLAGAGAFMFAVFALLSHHLKKNSAEETGEFGEEMGEFGGEFGKEEEEDGPKSQFFSNVEINEI